MKIFSLFIALLSLSMIPIQVHASKSFFQGKVLDKTTGEPLVGVNVYIPDLKTGALTDTAGFYKIENLPQSKILVQVSLLGYQTKVEVIDLDSVNVKNFELDAAIREMKEIIVTGTAQAVDAANNPAPVSIVSKKQLLEQSATNMIDAIATQPGLAQITTGAGISKPVIRGLGFNRVVVVNDGIRQEGQQWGDEHGVEIDEFSVGKVEILKGPASLSYGSDAMAGVIHFISAPTLPQGSVAGNVLANYQTNNGLIAYSANLAGNLKGFIWDVRYSSKMAHAYQNKYDGYVFNSAFKENTISGIIGLNKSWGYSHLHLSAYDLSLGIIEGERDSVSGNFVKPTLTGVEKASSSDLISYNLFTPHQQVNHYKAVLNNSFIIGNSTLKATLGFQQNQRKEYAEVVDPNKYGLYFLLNTINYDVRYLFPEKSKWNFSLGINGMKQNSNNKGSEYLVPEYSLFDIGAYSMLTKSIGFINISGGLRYDIRNQQVDALFLDTNGLKVDPSALLSIKRFDGFTNTFSGFSGSVGATYHLTEQIYGKFNISRGYRAPNIAELGSNGVHEGSLRYEIGNSSLRPETSMQADYSVGFDTHHISAEVNFFTNTIQNFIFVRKLNSVSGGDSITDKTSTFKFVSGNASLMGGEVTVDIHPHPLDWLHVENSFSIVHAVQENQPDSTKYLPYIPASRVRSELRVDLPKVKSYFKNLFFKVESEYYFSQDRVYSAYKTETPTPPYWLMNLGLGADVCYHDKTVFTFIVSVNNLLDEAYQNNLSRLKYASVNNATGRAGVYNMGRNLSFKILIPLEFKK